MKYCTGCGSVLKDEDRFCVSCGLQQEEVAQTEEIKEEPAVFPEEEPVIRAQYTEENYEEALPERKERPQAWKTVLGCAVVAVAFLLGLLLGGLL